MSYEYFIASRYRNKDTVLELAKKLREKQKTVYCFIESDASISHCGTVESDPCETMKKFEAIPDWMNDPGVRTIFVSDMNALKASETVILLLPAGKSAHMEAGAAYGFGKKMILIGDQQETESLYLIFDEFYPSIDSFIDSL